MVSVKSNAKQERLEARLTVAQKELIQHAANLTGRSISEFVVSSVQEAARRAIQEHEVITLSARDSVRFVEVLMNPPAPNENLKSAARRHRKYFGN